MAMYHILALNEDPGGGGAAPGGGIRHVGLGNAFIEARNPKPLTLNPKP
jgi:hypothetical protein